MVLFVMEIERIVQHSFFIIRTDAKKASSPENLAI